MKRQLAAAFVMLWAGEAAGAAAPVVNERTGGLSYEYSFPIPSARGQYQPALTLAYSSQRPQNVGFGNGWQLGLSYVEKRSRTRYASKDVPRVEYWLTNDGSRALLLPVTGDKFGSARPDVEYRMEVAGGYYAVTYDSVAKTWTGNDGIGNRYEFSCDPVVLFGEGTAANFTCDRWYLSTVTDPDGNVSKRSYLPEVGPSGEASSSALLKWVRYNAYDAQNPNATARLVDPSDFATEIELTYVCVSASCGATQTIPMLMGEEAGVIVDHRHRLDTVKVRNASASGQTTVASYRLEFGGGEVLRAVTAWGGEFVAQGDVTRFGYGEGVEGIASASFELLPSESWAVPSGFEAAAWVDVDADGRPDLAKGTAWKRNITEPGATVPSFEGSARTWDAAWVAFGHTSDGTHFLEDVDGDGVLDIFITDDPSKIRIRFGSVDASHNITFSSHVVADAAAPLAHYSSQTSGPFMIRRANADGVTRADLVDVTGDGFADLVIRDVEPNTNEFTSFWAVFPGYRDESGGVGFGTKLGGANPELEPFDPIGTGNFFGTILGGTGACIGGSQTLVGESEQQTLDINGDGLVDHVCVENTKWHAELNTSASFGATLLWFSGGSVPGVAEGLYSGEQFVDACGNSTVDPSTEAVIVRDLNGDSTPDHLYYDSQVGKAWIYWNNGRELVAGPAEIPFPGWPSSSYQASRELTCSDGVSVTEPARGVDALVIDIDADGILDFVTKHDASGSSAAFHRGYNGTTVARQVLLRSVTIPDGATFDIDYAPFAVASNPGEGGTERRSGPPLVRSVRTSGPALAAQRISYWYAGPRHAGTWYEPSAVTFRGFRDTWTQDAVTRIVRHSSWETEKQAFLGLPLRIEGGVPDGTLTVSGVPVYRTISVKDLGYAARAVSAPACIATTVDTDGCGSPHDAVAEGYPLIRYAVSIRDTRYWSSAGTQQATPFTSSIRIAEAYVDEYGVIGKITVDPDMSSTALNDEVVIVRFRDDADAVCKVCDQRVEWRDPAAAESDPPLQRKKYEYTSTGRYIREAEGEPGVTRAYNGNGTLNSVSVNAARCLNNPAPVVTSYLYDDYQLRVDQVKTTGPLEVVSSDGTSTCQNKSIVTDAYYDSGGRIARTEGPYLDGSSGTAKTQAAFSYDSLGRLVVISRTAPIEGRVSDAYAAFEYEDNSWPRAVKSYRFAVPKEHSPGTAVADADDVTLRIEYRDGLGRPLQVRERLGTGVSAAEAAKVAQSVTGYRVSSARIRDGAGRVTASLQPFYSASSTFQDYTSTTNTDLPVVTDPQKAARATFTIYDEEGRVECSYYRPVSGTLPEAQGDCTSSTSDDANYRLASSVTYGVATRNQRPYAAVLTIVGDKTKQLQLFDAAGRLAATEEPDTAWESTSGNAVRILRDQIGRETASIRESSDKAKSVEAAVSYDIAGRVKTQTDPSHGTRTLTYDAAGRVTEVTLANDRQDAISYTYEDLGRLTAIVERWFEPVCDPGGGTCWTEERTTSAGRFAYDSPYKGDTAYEYTAGRRSWEGNATSTIALGYSHDGLPVRRDQYIAGVEGRHGVAVAHRLDGAPTSVTFGRFGQGTPDANALEYAISYDSAGRSVRLAGASNTYWELTSSSNYGSYDAAGRPSEIRADDGHARVVRTYSPYTGRQSAETKALDGGTLFQIDGIKFVAGQLAEYTDSVTSVTYSNTYDYAGGSARLTKSTATSTGDPCAPLAQDFDEQYGFNLDNTFMAGPSIGNVERVSRTVTSCDAGGAQSSRVVDANYSYDEEDADKLDAVFPQGGGDLGGEYGSGTELFGYDLHNRVVSITRSNGTNERLAYAASGELVRRQIGSEVIFYVGEHATVRGTLPWSCTEPSESCKVDAATVTVDAHVLLGSTRIASVSASRTLYYYRDRLGSVVATSLAGGQAGAQYRYTPYGARDKVVNETAANASELGFSGAITLTEDLVHLRARVYHPRLRRFVSADVVDVYRYTYTLGDPVNLVDPSGLRAREVTGYEDDGYVPLSAPFIDYATSSTEGEYYWRFSDDDNGGWVINTGKKPSEQYNYVDHTDLGSGDPYFRYIGDASGPVGGTRGDGPDREGGPRGPARGLGSVLTDIGIGMLPGVGQFGISSLLEDPITMISLAEGAAQFAASVGLGVVVAMLIPVAGAAAPLVIPAAMIVGGLTSAVIGAVASKAKGESFSWSRAGLDFAVGAVGASVPGLMQWSIGGRRAAAAVVRQVTAAEIGWDVAYTWASESLGHGLRPTSSP